MDHDAMRRIIAKGETVIHQGQALTSYDQLPSPVDLALGSPVAEANAMDTIESKIETLQAEKKRLEVAQAERERAEAAQAKADAEASKEAQKEASKEEAKKEELKP